MNQNRFMDNESFYELIKEIREIVKNPDNTRCVCPNTFCEWHGKCAECVAQHRYYGKHVPTCLQPILREKINALAETAELYTNERGRSTAEHWQYVHDADGRERRGE